MNFWIMQAVAMLLTIAFIPRLRLTGITGVVFLVAAIALVNLYLWDAHLFFSLPETLSARAGLLVVANGVIFWILVKLLPGVEIDGLLPALAAPIVFTATTILVRTYGGAVKWDEVFQVGSEWIVQTMHVVRQYFES